MNRREAFDWIEKNVAPSSCPLLSEIEESVGGWGYEKDLARIAEVRRINARLRNALANFIVLSTALLYHKLLNERHLDQLRDFLNRETDE
jgi:hypothetical protein